ncbi:MAG: ribosomal protein S18-alanine N-acetyltransferase [Bryobacteraceae bacterium]
MVHTCWIRRFRADNMEDILRVENACFGRFAYDRKLFAEYAQREGGLFLVAGIGRRICGYSIACVRGGACRHAAELVSIGVEPLARGQGVASLLLENMFRRLRMRGVRRVALTVRVGNQRAQALYQRFGFRRQRIVTGYYEDGKDGVRMAVRWGAR